MRKSITNVTFVQPPILSDADPETSIDLDKTVGALQEKNPNVTKSVFEITVRDLDSNRASREFFNFEAKKRQEIKDWKVLFAKALSDLKAAKGKHESVDWSILSKEKQEFLKKQPDLERLLRQMQEVRCEAVKFLENNYIEILNLKEKISDLQKEQTIVAKERFLAELAENKFQ